MGEIYIYPVFNAIAKVTPNGIRAKFVYESDRTASDKRFPANPEFGLSVYNNLLTHGFSTLATGDNPLRSPSGGAAYVLSDGKIITHRRDKKAPTHPLQHSIPGGFPSCERQTLYPAEIMVVEGSEMVLVTKEKPHRLVVSRHDPVARAIAIDAANKVGIDIRNPVEVDFYHPYQAPDILDIYVGGDLVSSTRAYLQFLWEAEAAVNALQLYHVDFDPENIIPIDTEGMTKDGTYIHFNRESFVFSPEDISGRRFGDKLDSPVVYKSQRTDSGTVPVLQTEEPQDAPYIFQPDDMLSRLLYGLSIWKGNWLEHFRYFHLNAIGKKK